MPPKATNSSALRVLQAAYPRRNVREVVAEAYNQHGGLEGAAKHLGVSVPTLRSWITEWGGVYEETRQRRLVFPIAAEAA